MLPLRVVPFPRGFAIGQDGRLFLASGIGPDGQGHNAVVAFNRATPTQPSRLVEDPELSPLDLAIAPNGNIVVSSERPFGPVGRGDERSGIRYDEWPPRPSFLSKWEG